MTDAIIAFTTCPTEQEAATIARAIVEERLAGCVQLLPIRSVYRWRGALEESNETLMLFKTTVERYPELQKRITELHSYEVPEILAAPVSAGAQNYLAWLMQATTAAG